MTHPHPDASSLYTVGSEYERVPCDQCFKTLDPNAGDPLNRAFVHCGRCDGNFHEEHGHNRCLRCGNEQMIPMRVIAPLPLIAGGLRRPTALKPFRPKLITVDGQRVSASSPWVAYGAVVRYGTRLAAMLLLALGFTALAAIIGAYTSRWLDVYQQAFQSSDLLEQLLNTVLREVLPRQIVFGFAFISAAVTAYALFPAALRDRQGYRHKLRWLWRIVGGLILLIILNILYFHVIFIDYKRFNDAFWILPNSSSSREILLAQIGAATAAIILAIPYLVITRKLSVPPPCPTPIRLTRIAIGLLKYVLVFYIIVRLAITTAALQLGIEFSFADSPIPRDLSRLSDSEARILIMALSATAIAVLAYHIPRNHFTISAKHRLNFLLRMLLFMGCVVLAGVVYSGVNSDLLVESAILGGGIALVLLPVQRAYT